MYWGDIVFFGQILNWSNIVFVFSDGEIDTNLLFVFIGLQHSVSTLLSLVCFQEITQAQDNIDSLKGTHFS
jgi:hypothetical protein